MSAIQTGSLGPPALEPVVFAALADAQPTQVDWLWNGYVGRHNITLLTSQWKSGKTTLLSVLMSRLHTGGVLAGREVQPASTVIVSEESPALWRLRGERLDFGPQARFLCRPFVGKPTHEEWSALLDRLAALRAQHGIDLAVIDPLSAFLPAGAENDADALLTVLRPLQRLTEAGLAIVLLHHPKKGAWRPGQAARGSGAIGGFVDVMIEMNRVPNSPRDDRRRQLSAWSRQEATPYELLIELTPDGRDYAALAPLDPATDAWEQGLVVIQDVLTRHGRQMTRNQVFDEWPARAKPSFKTLWRWLDYGVERGELSRAGTGNKADPFRYAISGMDAEAWEPSLEDILADLNPFRWPKARK